MVQFYADPELQKHHNHAFQTVPITKQSTVLPPGLDTETFERALARLRDVVGEENLAVGEGLRDFRDPYPLQVDENQPSAAAW